MHDWTFLSFTVDWSAGTARLKFLDRRPARTDLCVRGLCALVLERSEPWGPSVSVDAISGPEEDGRGASHVEIRMQSGDTIRIEAGAFAWDDGRTTAQHGAIVAQIDAFLDGIDRSVTHAGSIESALRDAFPDEESTFRDAADDLAQYRPGGGECLLDEATIVRTLLRVRRQLATPGG